MATAHDYATRKVSGSRTRTSLGSSTSGYPHTPTYQRSASGLYSSSGSTFRPDEEHLVFEIGSRYLRAGFPGESNPRCTLNFGPEEQRRVGDYRQWMPGYSTRRRKRKRGEDWGQAHELWRMDLRDVDLGLVQDRLERALREAYNKYIMVDSKLRVTLTLPGLMPHPLLSTVLNVFFSMFQAPSVTLLSSPVMAAVAAGVRSALVVDIGWAETTVTAVYEFREVHQRRSIRAAKVLSEEMSKVLNEEIRKNKYMPSARDDISFEETEEILCRVGWCMSREESIAWASQETATSPALDDTTYIPLPCAPTPTTLNIPFSRLAQPVETALFATKTPPSSLDDHDQPLPTLIHTALLSLGLDARQLCMSRIIFTGGVSQLPGLKARLLADVAALVAARGWDPVRNYGSATATRDRVRAERERSRAHAHQRQSRDYPDAPTLAPTQFDTANPTAGPDRDPAPPSTTTTTHPPPPTLTLIPENEAASSDPPSEPTTTTTTTTLPTHLRAPTPDPILSRLQHRSSRHRSPNPPSSSIRAIASLGPWQGASLAAHLRLRGAVEIDRERFLAVGLVGAAGVGGGSGAIAGVGGEGERHGHGHGHGHRSSAGGGSGGHRMGAGREEGARGVGGMGITGASGAAGGGWLGVWG